MGEPEIREEKSIDHQEDPRYVSLKDSTGKSCLPNKYEPKASYLTPATPLLKSATTTDDDGLAGTNLDEQATLPPPLALTAVPVIVLEMLDSIPDHASILDYDVTLLHKALHADPFRVLGTHRYLIVGDSSFYVIFRAWVKDAASIDVRIVSGISVTLDHGNEFVPMVERTSWLFQRCFKAKRVDGAEVTNADIPSMSPEYRVTYHGDASKKQYTVRDTYSIGTQLTDTDLRQFQSGSCWHVDSLMGAHIVEVDGVFGVRFSVWAPSAEFVRVVGDWNAWDGRAHPMRKRHDFGVWELFVPNIGAGEKYGYSIHRHGKDFVKIDPYAQEFENPPAHASIISGCDDAYKKSSDRFNWTDSEWMTSRTENGKKRWITRMPMAIYEVHLPSWMRGENNTYLGYRQLADPLVNHMKKLNFTHVEFLPLAHHPFEGSWGYQVSGQYAPYSRLGNADDFKFLVNELHRNGLGVFVDFVPAHFCKDDWGLVGFDGSPLYEYADPREGEHKGWGTLVYNFRRNEVRSYLLGAAYHWLRRYHIDGLRIDAVSSMLYKNYCRQPGEWLPNEHGGDANLQAISLLQELNWVVHQEFPGVFTMAEESTSWQGVTNQEGGGLGFDAKWDLGWMNDSLSYLCTPPPNRWQKHSKLTFRGLYLAHEHWVLPLSHDEVVSGKGSLLDKCGFAGAPFDERIKTLRTLFGLQVGMPGRPLIFMGAEFGQGREWKELRSLDWHESQEDLRTKLTLWVSDLLGVYRAHPALHAGDDESWNFQWVDCDNAPDCIIAWTRKWQEWHNDILVVCNFSGQNYYRYSIGVAHGGDWKVLLNSDDWRYGGAMHGPGNLTCQRSTQGGRLGWPYCLWLDIPAFGCLILQAPRPKESLDGSPPTPNSGESSAPSK